MHNRAVEGRYGQNSLPAMSDLKNIAWYFRHRVVTFTRPREMTRPKGSEPHDWNWKLRKPTGTGAVLVVSTKVSIDGLKLEPLLPLCSQEVPKIARGSKQHRGLLGKWKQKRKWNEPR